jgi:cyclohexanone monooxygenase
MADIKNLAPSDLLGPKPPQTALESDVSLATKPKDLPFDPDALRNKYIEERDRRLKYGQAKGGIAQYRLVEHGGPFAHYLRDPWVKPGFTRDPIDEQVDVVIIGGGYGAQLVAVRLIEAGISNIKIIEKAGDFGGTWYWNRYPGAQCDIESYIYMPLLEELGYMPTEKYARANELLRHAEMIGRRWKLYDKALFQTETHSMHWDEATCLWTTKTNRGDTIRSRFVIPAAGPLHRPKLPGLPGIEAFKGHSFHSSRWDYDYTGGDTTGNLHKLRDKRVGIIGTGATAVQIVPHLGKWAKEVYVFQRTPSSIDVRGNKPTDPEWAASLRPGWQKERMDNFNIIVNGGITDVDLVQDGWTDILHKLLARAAPTKDGEPVDPARAAAERQIADYEKMEQVRARADAVVDDPATAAALKPWYNQLCKRPCFHDEYLQTFNLPTVHLVDTAGKGVDAITEAGVVANGQLYELDTLVYATGFELATEYAHRANMQIYGRGGRTITDAWKQGTRTLHGWTTRDFPNCFWVQIVQAALSPNFLHVTGEQAAHLAYVISECKRRGVVAVEPTAQAEKSWVDTILTMAQLRADFLAECTPGYYNNEGTADAAAAKNASYGGGAPAFLALLKEWRDKGDLEGLELRYAESGSGSDSSAAQGIIHANL